MSDCKSRIRLHAGGPFLAKSIVAIALCPIVVQTGVVLGEPLLLKAMVRDSGVRILTFQGPHGQVCQAQFNNVVLLFDHVEPGQEPDDEEAFGPSSRRSEWQVRLVQGTADEFVFGTRQTAAVVSSRLEIILRRQVGAINDLCDLTDVQLQKIILAGRGDIQRLLDRAAKLKGQIERPVEIGDVEQFQAWCIRLGQESARLGATLNSGPFDMNSLFAKTLRTTLTSEQLKQLKDLKGILLASTTPPANGVRLALARVDDPQRLDTILKEWDLAAAGIHRLDCNFIRMKYDPVFEVEFRGEGSLAVDRRGRALYKIAAADIIPGVQSRKVGRGGAPYELKSDSPERFYWTGETFIKVDDREHTYEVAPIPPARQHAEFRPEPPALPEEVGSDGRRRQPATDSDLIAGFGTWFDEPLFGWTKPFLLGMPTDELKRRFKVTLLSEDDAEVRLELEPMWPRDKAQFSRAQLILSKVFYRPRALKVVGPSGAETVHVFRDVAVDTPDDRASLDRPDLARFRKIVNDRVAPR